MSLLGDQRLPRRFWAKIAVSESGCWEWTGALYTSGYGMFVLGGKNWRAHRLTYARFVGPLPDGQERLMVVDHLCQNRRCCNPEHLEVISHRLNMARGVGQPNIGVRARLLTGKCQRGHRDWIPQPKAGPNSWKCRECDRELSRLKGRAAAELGLTQRAYIAQYGQSRRAALEVLGAKDA